MPAILDWIAAGKRPGSVPRFDDIAFAAIRLNWQTISYRTTPIPAFRFDLPAK